MTSHSELTRNQLKHLLIRNWMTHDALWYNEVADSCGMEEASPMNLRVCRNLGRIEFGRLIKQTGASRPTRMAEYRILFELGKEIFFPDFMSVAISYGPGDRQRFRVLECFAHRGMAKAGRLAEYQCGIFERIEGWLDAMGLEYERFPDLDRCEKFRGRDCDVTLELHFGRQA